MSERKVLNKYYPPDFDPSKIPRLHLPKDRQYIVRLMAPCNMRCKTCGEYIYKGKKFNARKETVNGEDYLGIKIFRFYIKCTRCLAEITFKTDPQNADYIVEHGATRNFQALKLAEEQAEREQRELEEEEASNPMKLLENRTKASKYEMETLENLEELRDLNQRQANVDFEYMLQQNSELETKMKQRQEDEDEAFIQSVFGKNDGVVMKRLADDDSDEEDFAISKQVSAGLLKETFSDILLDKSTTQDKVPSKKMKTETNSVSNRSFLSKLITKKADKSSVSSENSKKQDEPKSNALSLLGTYDDSDETTSD